MSTDHGLPEGVRVIDVDTHLTEPHDLWTSRAPERWKDRVPRVVEVDGVQSWVVEDIVVGPAHAASVVAIDGSKMRGADFRTWMFDDTHTAAWDVDSRLAYMDEQGIWAQVIYPNAAGFGNQKFSRVQDPELRTLCTTLYNEAMIEMQEASGNRLFPMALIPWWDADASVAEVRRAHDMGLKGINTCSEPQNRGVPDLGTDMWTPLWEVCSDLGMPVNFHIGASESTAAWSGSTPWASQGEDQKIAIGSAMLFLSNAIVLSNLVFSGVLERFPKLKIVSVESGIGWVPFVLEALDYQMVETAPRSVEYLSMKPSDYFRRQVYACFWFEQEALPELVARIGADNIMFETDFPHPTCLYPDSIEHAARALHGISPDVQRKLLQDNAVKVYGIELPA